MTVLTSHTDTTLTTDKGGRDKITRIVNQAGRMIGEPRQNLEDVYTDLLITKLTNMMDDASHQLHDRAISLNSPRTIGGAI